MSRHKGALGMAEWVLQRMIRITSNKKGILSFVTQWITVETADHYGIVSNCS